MLKHVFSTEDADLPVVDLDPVVVAASLLVASDACRFPLTPIASSSRRKVVLL